MAVTKILARHYRVDVGINYVLNGDKTEEKVLTAYQNCTPDNAYERMTKTKKKYGKTDGVQSYHIIQAFKPDEVSPALALDIAKTFAAEHLEKYEAVIGVHVDKAHIHAHIVFNSVSCVTGEKYHSNAKSYYTQIRAISDRLCKEHDLSVIITGEKSRRISYYEWMRERRRQPTFRSMLEADLRRAIDDANDYGHFLMLMENMGYEVKHGNRLSFRLRGTDKWYVPGRQNAQFTEDGIRAAIQGNLEAIEAGLKPAFTPRRVYVPYVKRPKYTGFLALYAHYLYLLRSIEKQEYPPKLTPHLKAEIMKFEKYKVQFEFMRKNDITTPAQLQTYMKSCEEKLSLFTKQRTILNVQKKKRKPLYDALADAEALKPAKALYDAGMTGIEDEFSRYLDALNILESSGIPKDRLAKEKAEVYEKISAVNNDIREARKEITMCKEIYESTPTMEKQIKTVETKERNEVNKDVRRR